MRPFVGTRRQLLCYLDIFHMHMNGMEKKKVNI